MEEAIIGLAFLGFFGLLATFIGLLALQILAIFVDAIFGTNFSSNRMAPGRSGPPNWYRDRMY